MEQFNYTDQKFADIQMLRYNLPNFEKLSIKQKLFIYCLSKAALYGRDITFDQFCKHNLKIRKTLETVYKHFEFTDEETKKHFMEYLKCVWFANGIHHHYSSDKFLPSFEKEWFIKAVKSINTNKLPLKENETVDDLLNEIIPVIFDKDVMAKKVSLKAGEDLVETSACNYYENVNQQEAETFYKAKQSNSAEEPSWGLNSKLIKHNEIIEEQVWKVGGMYGKALSKIVEWLEKAIEYAENNEQKDVIKLLINYYNTGCLKTFDDYSIAWLKCNNTSIDFINGFIEVYGDPISIKGSWESLVEYVDYDAAKRTKTISENAQWFEDNAPTRKEFKKEKVKGVTANAVYAAMLGGDEYPSTAIGINLPNADWIREKHGSKSVTITNITHAYNQNAKGNGFLKEFIIDENVLKCVEKYGDLCDNLHTDLHECLGHGSGKLLKNVSPDALKSYSNAMEEARADLFALYYLADNKLIELGLLPDKDAYKSSYYTYIMNGAVTQLVRIQPNCDLEEAHMRNRALIANYVIKHSKGNVSLQNINGKTYLNIQDYEKLRITFGELLGEVQRIKSEGDYNAAKNIVEQYGVKVNKELHKEVILRYKALNISPYKGFINPRLHLIYDKDNNVCDVKADYSETYEQQMMRYSTEYSTL